MRATDTERHRWVRKKTLGYDILSCDLIIVPINVQNTHWEKKEVWYLDSYGAPNLSCATHLLRFVRDVKLRLKNEPMMEAEWSVRHRAVDDGLPVQKDGFNCGVFVLESANFLVRCLARANE